MISQLDLSPILETIHNNFELICQQNPELKLELSESGELIIMSPTGGETGKQKATLLGLFFIWNQSTKLGILFDSSTCFKLPTGAQRSPDLAWIAKEKWLTLTLEQRKKFPPIAPDFVVELLSPTDSLTITKTKMAEYMRSGVKLAWLINPSTKQVDIYRSEQPTEVLDNPDNLYGANILPN